MKMRFLEGHFAYNKFIPESCDESVLGDFIENINTIINTYSSFEVKKVKDTDYYYLYSKRIHIPSQATGQIDPIKTETIEEAERIIDDSIKKLFSNDFSDVVNEEDFHLFWADETRPKVFWDIWHNIIIVEGQRTLMDFARWIEIASYSRFFGSGEVPEDIIYNLIMHSDKPATQYALGINLVNIKISTGDN